MRVNIILQIKSQVPGLDGMLVTGESVASFPGTGAMYFAADAHSSTDSSVIVARFSASGRLEWSRRCRPAGAGDARVHGHSVSSDRSVKQGPCSS